MSRRLVVLAGLVAIVLLSAGGVLLATSHSSGTSSAPTASCVLGQPDATAQFSSMEPVSCPRGCISKDCNGDNKSCTCKNGQLGICHFCNGSFACVP